MDRGKHKREEKESGYTKEWEKLNEWESVVVPSGQDKRWNNNKVFKLQ